MRTTQPPAASAQVESARLRLTFLTLLVVSLFVLLFARLWFLQVMASNHYAQLAQGNATRTVTLPAPRGKVLDRDGRPLVRNRYAMVVSVQPAEMGDRKDEVLDDLANLLGMDPQEVRRRAEDLRVGAYRPRPIAIDVPEDIVFYIHENASTHYPGVYAEQTPVRVYPAKDEESGKTWGAHVLGYLGEVSAEELEDPAYEGYRPGDLIGRAGVERSHERVLRGQEGRRELEVNARGHVLRVLDEVVPQPGSDLVLALDLDAQQAVEQALEEGILRARKITDQESGPGRGGLFRAPAGAAVVLDPTNGDVVAMASYPTFDPDQFVGGVSRDYWRYLQDKENAFPLINRAVQSSYPPGSVFKVVTASAALRHGYMTAESRLPCPGRWQWNQQVYRNWTRTDEPPMNLVEALEDSCDTVFYELARRMWTDEEAQEKAGVPIAERLSEEARLWGFGTRTGIDLPAERAGVVPGREWKQQFWERHRETYCLQARRAAPETYEADLFSDLCEHGNVWRGGDEVNMSIGQGDLQTTPLQVANAFAAIANGGTLYRPRVAREVLKQDGTVEPVAADVLGTLPLDATSLALIADGLERVTSSGTAESVFGNFPIPLAGKTGTAEIRPKQPFAWFAAYAPADAPRYVVVAMVEEGDGGSLIAAPIVRRILEGLFDLEQSAIRVGEMTD